MRVFGLPKSFYRISGPPPSRLSPTAREHWRYVSCWQALRRQGLSAAQASHNVGVPRPTLYRWMAEDAPMRRDVIKAEAESAVRFVAVVTSSALGRPAQHDTAGRVVRAEVPPSPSDAKWMLTHRWAQEWGDRVTFDLEEAVEELADADDAEKAAIMAEVDDILDRR